jgi:hypothetical protein
VASRIIILDRGESPTASLLEALEAHIVVFLILLRLLTAFLERLARGDVIFYLRF